MGLATWGICGNISVNSLSSHAGVFDARSDLFTSMWFILLAIALAIVASGGLYFRHRFVQALAVVGVSLRGQRIARWAIPMALFAYPVALFIYIGASIALGRNSIATEPTGLLLWLIVFPFWISVLILIQSLPFLLVFDVGNLLVRNYVSLELRGRYRGLAILSVAVFFGIYTPVRIGLARNTLNIHRYELGDGQYAIREDTFRIVFWGDLQRDQQTDAGRTNQVVDMINAENADLILFGGDWINTGSNHINAAAAAGGRLQSRFGTFSVRGDHEHFAYMDRERSVGEMSQALAKQNVQMPHNEVRWFEHRGKRIAVAFLSHNYVVRSPKQDTLELLAQVQEADYSILMTHQLDTTLAQIANDRVDLILAAHTHGGQVNPVVGFVHVSLARVETPYVEGQYQLGERTTVIVTAGIGYSIAPFRYASPASFEVIDLRI